MEPVSYPQYRHDTDRLVEELENITILYLETADELRKARARIAELERRRGCHHERNAI
jgi:hypothetical protein